MPVKHMTSADWEHVRSIRLHALTDSPDAFSMTLAEEQARSPESWRERLEKPTVATIMAQQDGEYVGMVVSGPWTDREDTAGLFSMWVAPEARGSGIGDELVEAVIEWVRAQGYRRLVLDVADENGAAIKLYERHGFEPTGVGSCLPPPREDILEHERCLELAGD
jgi:ribosomal protein S18 acetylase RimI-like enzyme